MTPDPRVWRVHGSPLVGPTGSGSLDGRTVAVKDLYAVAGQQVGAGNPAWLAQAEVESRHSDVVARLLAAGAAIAGLTHTDEFAYSLLGANAHYGTPPNPAAPGRLPGGSSSGSATAVALGQADVGLGTDTGGSVRVPAAFQGLFGLRTTHDVVSRLGLLPLAPTFDAVGWLARDPETLRAAGDALLPDTDPVPLDGAVVLPELLALAIPEIADGVAHAAAALDAVEERWDLPLDAWRDAFVVLQGWEAWQEHGEWLLDRLDTLGDDVRARFGAASAVTPDQAEAARATVATARRTVRDLLGHRVLVQPAASAPPPHPTDDLATLRADTLRLTCVAGLAGLPVLAAPPWVCLVGPVGSDAALLDLACRAPVGEGVRAAH